MNLRFPTTAALAMALLIAPVVEPTMASDEKEVRRALEAGEVRPLTEILTIVRPKLAGEIVRVKIEREDDVWIYEFRIVDKRGRLSEVYIDARNGDIKRIKEK